MLTISNYQRNANQNYKEVSPHSSPNGHHQSLQIINAGEGVEKKEPSYTVGGNVLDWPRHLFGFFHKMLRENLNQLFDQPNTLVQPLWTTVFRFLKKLKIELPYDPAIPLLGIYPEKTII